MQPIRFILLLLSTLILTISSASSGKLPKYITDKKKLITFESTNITYIKGNESLEKKISYFVFYNDHSYTKVTKEYFENINIGNLK